MRKFVSILLILSIHVSLGQTNTAFDQKTVDNLLEKGIQDWNIAGMSIVIVKDDSIIYNKGFGYKDAQFTKKITPLTQFAMGSSAKAFTGALIAQADTDSILKLDHPVSEQTAFALENDYFTENVTFKDLLTHNTGVPGHDFIWISQQMDRQELSDRLKYLPTTKSLRQSFQYNNILYATAGFLAANIMETTWEEALRKKLFTPMGMNHTGFEIPEQAGATDYTSQFFHNGATYIPLPFRDLSLIAPAGGVYTNSTDLSKWLRMLLNEGMLEDKKVLDKLTVQKMFHPYVVSMFPRKFKEHFYENYGLGWMITDYRGILHIHHAGNIDGFTSTIDLWPEQNIGIAILTNTAYANNFTDIMKFEIIDQILKLDDIDWNKKYRDFIADKSKPSKSKPNSTEDSPEVEVPLSQFAGTYENKAYGQITISVKEKTLSAQYGFLPMQLVPVSGYMFLEQAVVPGQKFWFVTDVNKKITGLKSEFPSSNSDILFTKIN